MKKKKIIVVLILAVLSIGFYFKDDITKINLTAETKFYLEYTQNEISYKVNDYT